MKKVLWTTLTMIIIEQALSQDIIPKLPISFPNSNNSVCKSDSLKMEKALDEKMYWAMKMYDASVKLPVGMVSGTTLQFGDFDECLSVREPVSAQYCIVTIVLLMGPEYSKTDPFTLEYSPYESVWEVLNDRGVDTKQPTNIIHIGLCIPDTCNEYDLKYEINKFLETQNLSIPMVATIIPNACTTHENDTLNVADLLFCFTVVVLILLGIFATVYDIKFSKTSVSDPDNFLLCFSLKRSYDILIKPTPLLNGIDLNRISGLYLISTFTVVLGHRLGMFMVGAMINYELLEKIFRVPKYSMWASHVSIVVDCFFILSGFLVGMLLPNYTEKNKPNIFMIWLNRYIRLMPACGIITFFYATMIRFTGDGPLWNFGMRAETEYCRENWWTNLLFVNNYINTERSCIVQTWYLPCDFHLFLLVTMTFYLIKDHQKIFKSTIIALIFVAVFVHFYGTYVWNLTPYSLFFKRMWDDIRAYDFFKRFYIKTHFRATPYLAGFLAGYIMYKSKPTVLSKTMTYLLMFAGTILLCLTYWSGCLFSEPSSRHLGFYAAFYSSVASILWTVGYLMIIMVVLIGSDNPLQKFYSWKFFVPIGKLSYNIYLLHMYVQIRSGLSKRTASYLTINEWIGKTITDIIYSCIIGLAVYMFVENPCRSLIKLLIFGKPKEKQNNPV